MSTIDQLLTDDYTRADSLIPSRLEPPTRTSQDDLAERVGHLRGSTQFLLADVAETHDQVLEIQLSSRTDEAAKRSVSDLLTELAELGFAWRDIARLVGVTVPALRKWRHGEPATGQHRRTVAGLVAFVSVVQSEYLIQDVASWMEMPLADSQVTGIDVFSGGGVNQLLLHAAGHLSSEELLDSFEPSWRDAIDDRFEVVTGGDGQPFIRMRPSEQPG